MLSTASGGLSTVCLLIFTSLHAKLCNGYLEISKRRTTQLGSLCFLSSPPLWGSGWASIGPRNPTCYSSWLFSSIHGGCAFSGLLTSFAFTVSLGLWSDIPSHVSANTSYSTYSEWASSKSLFQNNLSAVRLPSLLSELRVFLCILRLPFFRHILESDQFYRRLIWGGSHVIGRSRKQREL